MNASGDSARELIRLTGVKKSYGRQLILDIPEFVVRQGDRIAVVGSNGSGKSTLLRILGGIAPIQEGAIRWDDGLQEEALGYVPQGGGLYGELSVRENFELRRRLYGLPPGEQAPTPFMAGLGLAPLMDKPYSELSGGFQRVAVLASALAVNPTWLFLDEPFAGVDEAKAEAVSKAVKRLTDQLRILVITAQLPDSVPGADRVVEVVDGRLQERVGGGM
jgi:ABC-type multidrug transport system ATPase subunit